MWEKKNKGKTGLGSAGLYFHHIPSVTVHLEKNKNATISTGGIEYISR